MSGEWDNATVWALAAAMTAIVGCAGQTADDPGCAVPTAARYSVTATPLDYGCGGTKTSMATFENGLVASGDRDETELVNSCTTRALNGRDSVAITFDQDWTYGSGRAFIGGCEYDLGLVRQ